MCYYIICSCRGNSVEPPGHQARRSLHWPSRRRHRSRRLKPLWGWRGALRRTAGGGQADLQTCLPQVVRGNCGPSRRCAIHRAAPAAPAQRPAPGRVMVPPCAATRHWRRWWGGDGDPPKMGVVPKWHHANAPASGSRRRGVEHPQKPAPRWHAS
jgi:hypothetical protein